MQRTGVSWVIYSMTHSSFMLGVSVFASQFPTFMLTLYGGIVSDRYDRYKVLLTTQVASAIQALLLSILVLSGHYQVWQILSLSVVLGVVNAFDVPARQPMVHEMIADKEDLPNAIALNSSMVHFARLTGPAVAGIILERFGAGFCFLLNAISFIFVITSLLLMKLPPSTQDRLKRKKIYSELSEGFNYMKNTPAIRNVLLMLTLMTLLVLPYSTLLPVFAKVVFRGGAETFGYINSFIGLGALIGAFFLASLKTGTDLKRILFVNSILLGIALIIFSQVPVFRIAMIFAVLCGFGTMSQTAICNTIMQVESAPAMRGRVISYLALAAFGMLSLGSLLIGFISHKMNAPTTMLCEGLAAFVIVGAFSKYLLSGTLKPHVEPTQQPIMEEEMIE
jgi:MFS family permease